MSATCRSTGTFLRPVIASSGAMKTTVGTYRASPWPNAGGPIVGRSYANITWPCHFGCCAIFRADCASPSRLDIAPERDACGRLPVLRLFIAFCIAIERPFEIPERDDKTGPAVDEAALEDVVLDERPGTMAECRRHRHSFAGQFWCAERGVAVHLVDDFFQVAEGKLPDSVAQGSGRPPSDHFEALVHWLERVADTALAKELRLAKIRIPARTLDPAAHHVAAARHHIDFVRRRASEQGKNFVADLGGATFVRVKAEDPVVGAGLDRTIAQVAETVESDIDNACAERTRNVGRAVGAE